MGAGAEAVAVPALMARPLAALTPEARLHLPVEARGDPRPLRVHLSHRSRSALALKSQATVCLDEVSIWPTVAKGEGSTSVADEAG